MTTRAYHSTDHTTPIDSDEKVASSKNTSSNRARVNCWSSASHSQQTCERLWHDLEFPKTRGPSWSAVPGSHLRRHFKVCWESVAGNTSLRVRLKMEINQYYYKIISRWRCKSSVRWWTVERISSSGWRPSRSRLASRRPWKQEKSNNN